MKTKEINLIALLIILIGGVYLTLSNPNITYAETCTGGCSGCFADTCHDALDKYYCGAIEPVDDPGNYIYCYSPEIPSTPEEN